MNSQYALGLSRAVKAAREGGDFIDHGWSLVKALHAEGFDIVPRERVLSLDKRTTLNEMAVTTRQSDRSQVIATKPFAVRRAYLFEERHGE